MMDKVALKLPGGQTIDTPVPKFTDLGSLLSTFLDIALFTAAFLAFYWLVWGAWAYLFSGGEKENLQKAKERIKWALIGLIVVFMAYFIAKYTGQIFPPGRGGLPF